MRSVSVRSAWFRDLVRAEPTALLKDGRLQPAAMRRERVTEADVLQAVRAQGASDLDDALVVYPQTDGSLRAILR